MNRRHFSANLGKRAVSDQFAACWRFKRNGMSVFNFVLGSVLWMMVLAALWYQVVTRDAQNSPLPQATVSDPEDEREDSETPKSFTISFPARELPDFEFPECMGGTVSRESMRGKQWLAVFVFTRCVETCPAITRHVFDLQQAVGKSNPEFQFVTFSVDSSYDTAEVLQKYAETFQADHERWKFVTGDENKIHDLIRRGFAQFVKPNLGELRKPGFEVAHSNRAVLVNEDCIPVATYLMTNEDDVARLRKVIQGKTAFPQPAEGLSLTPSSAENPAIRLNLTPVDDPAEAEVTAASESSDSDHASAKEFAESSKTDSPASISNAAGGSPGRAETPQVQTDESKTVDRESSQSRNRKIEEQLPPWVARLPTINAVLNLTCTILLISGFAAIRLGRRAMHRNLMVVAFTFSVVFLGCYLTYHEALYRFTGERGRAFLGSEVAGMVYRGILIPHVILAMFVPILALRVFWLAYQERWADHRRLARLTLPVWLFVSITGVVIYWMLYHWPWRPVPETLAAAL